MAPSDWSGAFTSRSQLSQEVREKGATKPCPFTSTVRPEGVVANVQR